MSASAVALLNSRHASCGQCYVNTVCLCKCNLVKNKRGKEDEIQSVHNSTRSQTRADLSQPQMTPGLIKIFLREGKCTLILKTTLVNNSFVLWDVSKTVTNDRKKSEETWEGEVEMFQWIKVSLFL